MMFTVGDLIDVNTLNRVWTCGPRLAIVTTIDTCTLAITLTRAQILNRHDIYQWVVTLSDAAAAIEYGAWSVVVEAHR